MFLNVQVNGIDLTQATHLEAKLALQQTYPICRLLVFREKADETTNIEREGNIHSFIFTDEKY